MLSATTSTPPRNRLRITWSTGQPRLGSSPAWAAAQQVASTNRGHHGGPLETAFNVAAHSTEPDVGPRCPTGFRRAPGGRRAGPARHRWRNQVHWGGPHPAEQASARRHHGDGNDGARGGDANFLPFARRTGAGPFGGFAQGGCPHQPALHVHEHGGRTPLPLADPVARERTRLQHLPRPRTGAGICRRPSTRACGWTGLGCCTVWTPSR